MSGPRREGIGKVFDKIIVGYAGNQAGQDAVGLGGDPGTDQPVRAVE